MQLLVKVKVENLEKRTEGIKLRIFWDLVPFIGMEIYNRRIRNLIRPSNEHYLLLSKEADKRKKLLLGYNVLMSIPISLAVGYSLIYLSK